MLTHSMVDVWLWATGRIVVYGLRMWRNWFSLRLQLVRFAFELKFDKSREVTYRVSSRSNVGGTHANTLKLSKWLKISDNIGFNVDCGVKICLHKMSMQTKTLSCKGVNNVSDTLDMIYGVESLCTGTATAFVRTSVNCFKSSWVNLK